MTLTEAAHWTKKLIWFAVGGFILFIVLVMVLIARSRPQHLPKYLYPDFACTNTKEEFLRNKLNIPSIEYTLESPEEAFNLETQTGRIYQIPEVVNVYRYDNPGQYLTVQDEAKILAEKLGFDPEKMQRIGTTVYRWADNHNRTLTAQARNLTFELKIDLSQRSARPDGELPTEEQAIKYARDFLSDVSMLSRDYDRETPNVMDIKIEQDGSFREAKYKQETDLIRVDFIRKASMMTIPSHIENAGEIRNMLEREGHKSTEEDVITPDGRTTLYKFNTDIATSNPYRSNISIYIGAQNPDLPGRGINRIYGIEFKNWVIDQNYCGTYKLLNPAQVLTYVQEGKASLVYLNEKDGDKVLQAGTKNVRTFKIMEVSLLYYDAPHEQEFLQPVYEVAGEATFTNGNTGIFAFYYPAIDYDFIQDNQQDLSSL
jgi:hypothetical protein